MIEVRNMCLEDCSTIEKAFKDQNWNKPKSQYELYYEEYKVVKREVLIANINTEFAGYVTIVWQSDYKNFSDQGIPEIKDLNVLKKYQRRGIATLLLDEAEKRIKLRSNQAGIGVGLTSDYGTAQRLYVKRGYVPDGLGLSKNGQILRYGDLVVIDDDVNLYLVKNL